MNCEHVKEDLSAYLDNALRLEEREYVAAHIKTCQSCKMLLADFAHFDVLLAQQPRVVPKAGLREKIFASREYLELIDSSYRSGSASIPDDFVYPLHNNRPKLVSLPGGRQRPETNQAALAEPLPLPVILPKKKYASPWKRSILYGMIAAGMLLSLGIGSLISWRHWQQQGGTSQADAAGITPRTAPRQHGPVPASTRLLFLHNGILWSSLGDGSSGATQLTTSAVTVANGWKVQPGISHHNAGNLIAYVDIKQGYMHIIGSEGQNDTLIPQRLVASNELTASIWDKTEGLTILNGLAWSQDGSTLAFVGQNGTQTQLGLYLYQTANKHVQRVPLDGTWDVSQPSWSPDSKRIAFHFLQNGTMGIAEYTLEGQKLLIIG